MEPQHANMNKDALSILCHLFTGLCISDMYNMCSPLRGVMCRPLTEAVCSTLRGVVCRTLEGCEQLHERGCAQLP